MIYFRVTHWFSEYCFECTNLSKELNKMLNCRKRIEIEVNLLLVRTTILCTRQLTVVIIPPSTITLSQLVKHLVNFLNDAMVVVNSSLIHEWDLLMRTRLTVPIEGPHQVNFGKCGPIEGAICFGTPSSKSLLSLSSEGTAYLKPLQSINMSHIVERIHVLKCTYRSLLRFVRALRKLCHDVLPINEPA